MDTACGGYARGEITWLWDTVLCKDKRIRSVSLPSGTLVLLRRILNDPSAPSSSLYLYGVHRDISGLQTLFRSHRLHLWCTAGRTVFQAALSVCPPTLTLQLSFNLVTTCECPCGGHSHPAERITLLCTSTSFKVHRLYD